MNKHFLWQCTHSGLKNLFAEERLDDVGAVKTVHAVHPKHSTLCAQRSLFQLRVQPTKEQKQQSHSSLTGYVYWVVYRYHPLYDFAENNSFPEKLPHTAIHWISHTPTNSLLLARLTSRISVSLRCPQWHSVGERHREACCSRYGIQSSNHQVVCFLA